MKSLHLFKTLVGYIVTTIAIKEFRPDTEFEILAPITPEEVLVNLYSKVEMNVNA